MRWWKWIVVTAVPVPVSNMPPGLPCQPLPEGFKKETRTVVVSYHRTRSFSAAVKWAKITRAKLRASGCVREAMEVQVWESQEVASPHQEVGLSSRLRRSGWDRVLYTSLGLA